MVRDRQNALIVDFFAGSGTTLNAVNLLNATDGGQRQCILVTNNEVSESEAKELKARGLQPGDDDYEALGICRSVTWPRSKFTIQGFRDVPLNPAYSNAELSIATSLPPFEKGGLGGILRANNSPSESKIPLNPPLAKGEASNSTIPLDPPLAKGEAGNSTIPLPGDYLTGRTVTREKRRTILQLGFAEGRNLALAQRKQLAALMPTVPQSKLEADTPWFLDDDCPATILWDVQHAENWLEALADTGHLTAVYIVTAENRLFKTLKEQLEDTLGPLLVEEEEKRPLSAGFPANLDYFKLDFLQPSEVQMGRQFAAILPMLWMMAGASGKRPEPPSASAPWLIPLDCPFAVLMRETRFHDFYRHIAERPDLTHVFIVTNSHETYCHLREQLGTRTVIQLYKDYLENFRIKP